MTRIAVLSLVALAFLVPTVAASHEPLPFGVERNDDGSITFYWVACQAIWPPNDNCSRVPFLTIRPYRLP
jgi:hypothetical protein